MYYFKRNLQGDVFEVYDGAGIKQTTFTYDAYGRCTVGGNTFIANRFKIRYRGYYYDTETGLYWVQTRYYNPDWCRWISPDSISYLDPETPHGLNLYIYENNNPTGKVRVLGGTNRGMLGGFSANTSFPTSRLSIVASSIGNNNFWNPHWENKWVDTGWPKLFVLSNEGFEAISWHLSVYNGSLFFDNNEKHSLYVSLGNISVFAGLVFPKDSSKDNKARFGFDASANVIEIGYDGRIIDASVLGLSIGSTCLLKDGKFKLEYGYGLWGWSVSIDFIELFKWLFGGE